MKVDDEEMLEVKYSIDHWDDNRGPRWSSIPTQLDVDQINQRFKKIEDDIQNLHTIMYKLVRENNENA